MKRIKIFTEETMKRIKSLMSLIFSIMFSFMCMTNVYAVWLQDMLVILTQPDNTIINVYQSGDEFHNWVHDENGFTIILDSITGYWSWAIAENGSLISTGFPIHLHSPQSRSLSPGENISNEKYLELRADFDEEMNDRSSIPPHTGIINSITIFIRFSDQTEFPENYAFYDNKLNGQGSGVNSLHQYFYASSFGNLYLNSPIYPQNVLVSYQSEYPRNYYLIQSINNPDGYYNDPNDITKRKEYRERELLRNAIEFVHDLIPESLVIDSDNDGLVDNVNFIIRGERAESDSDDDQRTLLWPHKYTLSDIDVRIHGKRVHTYNFNIEVHSVNQYGEVIEVMNVGTMAHEFGHSLGLPDWGSDNFKRPNVNLWCLMGWPATEYPPSLSAYAKWKYLPQWIDDLPIISSNGFYELYPLGENPAYHHPAYRINSPYAETEFFIVEFRKNNFTVIDYGLPNSGLIIYRVSNHIPKLFVYRADITDENDPYKNDKDIRNHAHFSLESGRTAINNLTNPAPLLSDNITQGGLIISNISSASGSSMTFYVTIVDSQESVYVRPGFTFLLDFYETIQEAIDACDNDTTVYIYPGTYTGHRNREITWPYFKKINIVGMSELNQSVIIDCEEEYRAFHIVNNESMNKISNLKITNSPLAIQLTGPNSKLVLENVIFDGTSSGLYESSGLKIGNISPVVYGDEIYLTNCEFIGYTNSAIAVVTNALSIKNSVFRNNTGTVGSSLDFWGMRLHLDGNLFQENIGTTDGANINIGATGSVNAYVKIENNKFINNVSTQTGSFEEHSANISIIWGSDFNTILIVNNIFWQSVNVLNDAPNIKITAYYQNSPLSINYFNNTEIGFGYASGGSFIVDADSYPIHIKNSIFTGKIQTLGFIISQNQTISNSWFANASNMNVPVDLDEYIAGFSLDSIKNIYTGNPRLAFDSPDPADISNYRPIWNSSVKSGLINNAHLDTNGNGIPFWDDPEDRKSDKTNLDIGAVQNGVKQSIFQHDFNTVGDYYWIALPYIDRLYSPIIGEFPHSRLGHVFHHQNENNLLSLAPRYLNSIEWKYNEIKGGVYYDMATESWIGDLDHLVDSRHGYKIHKSSRMTFPRPLVTNGFYCGMPNNLITLKGGGVPEDDSEETTIGPFEIWLGYFGVNGMEPYDVFLPIWDNLVEIKTQYWSMNRCPVNTDAWTVPDALVSLNFGEMVSIKYMSDVDLQLYWPQFFTIEQEDPYLHPQADYFEFEEEADYIPIYIYLPDELKEDFAGEIGMFIDDVCYGAAVIDGGEIVQICAYIIDLDFEESDVEFEIYEYGGRSGSRRIENYTVMSIATIDGTDDVNSALVPSETGFNKKEMFYVVSFKNSDIANDGDDILPLKTELEGNFPNPFNPVTTIKYNLSKQENVSLRVYNIRGQLVRTLVDEVQEGGSYSVVWSGESDSGRNMASGLYFYRFEAGEYRAVRRMVLLK